MLCLRPMFRAALHTVNRVILLFCLFMLASVEIALVKMLCRRSVFRSSLIVYESCKCLKNGMGVSGS